MTIRIKTKEDIEILREGGRRHAFILRELEKRVESGVSTKELDDYGEKLIREKGDIPAFLGYKPDKSARPYPASVCTSINEEIVHCVPSKIKVLKEGDIISLDLGLRHKGMITDAAITVPVGYIHEKTKELLSVTQEALYAGIDAARGGGRVGDIGYAIEQFVRSQKTKFGIVRTLSGHGVGYEVHEDPYITNFGKAGTGEELKAGMVIAIEPMLTLGTDDIVFSEEDDFNIETADKSLSAHFEHTILITDGEAEVLTKI